MVCYAIPGISAIVHGVMRKKFPAWKNNEHHKRLNLLLTGGAIFGFVDHLWNRQLFLIGPNFANDIMLGFTILASILLIWLVMVYSERMASIKETQIVDKKIH